MHVSRRRPSPHAGRRRLGAAIATVLAVTLGAASMTAVPADATQVRSATAESGGLLPMVPGARLASAGSQGYLTSVPHQGEDGKLRWTPYGGGAARDIVFDSIEGLASPSGDTVVTASEIHGTEVRNMATGTSFRMRTVDDGLDSLYGGAAGPDLFTRGATKLWLQDGDTEPRAVQGLDAHSLAGWVRPGDATHGLVDTKDSNGVNHVALIDLTDATTTYPYPPQARNPVISGNRLAWVEDDTATHTLQVIVRDRTTGADTVVPVPGTTAGADLPIGLLGDWVTYGTTALRAGTGEKVTLLDSVDSSSTTPDGTAQIVQGANSVDGAGVFRVSLGADGRPAVRLLAHAGTITSALHDLDNDGLPDLLGRDAAGVLWRDSAGDGRPRAEVGGGWQIYDKIEVVGDIGGAYFTGFLPEIVARDKAGVLWLYSGREDGGVTKRMRIGGGWQVYTHITGGSDLTGDGRPDLVAVDTSGVLWLYPSTGTPSRPFEPRKRIGSGWNIYNQLTAVGDLAGAPGGDLVARDRNGVLWLYLGTGNGTFTQRTKIGGGWQVYSELVGAGDVDHDGKADLFAYSPATRTVSLYSGTADRHRPFAPRTPSDALKSVPYNHIS
ncbi:FG-GAP repeat domain-containing protein [Streptomyces sp. NPDC020917]|uniref:FG-GAP repeat domain-containing protein n=1 Tax=Streptomyces sp. NPDC020917 TaxID=3365102 RepID=UPI00378A42D9